MRRTKPPSALEWQSSALPRHPTGAPELPCLHSHRLLSCPLWQAHPAPCQLIGIVSCSRSRALYERFYDGFASHGEPNIPFDKAFLRSEPFYTLLARLKQHVEEHQRDHWCPPQTLNLVLSAYSAPRASIVLGNRTERSLWHLSSSCARKSCPCVQYAHRPWAWSAKG